MTFVTAQPEMLTAAAGRLQEIGMTMAARNVAAATPTIRVVPAAADEVSALTAMQFSAHAASYQTVSAQASVIDEKFALTLGANGDSYTATEVANAIAAS